MYDEVKKMLLALYYGFASYVPMQPFPGYKVGYYLRRILAQSIFLSCGKDVVVKPEFIE